jgi:hypothetical protein
MSRDSIEFSRRQAELHRKMSAQQAKQLTEIGMAVVVRRDDGSEFATTLASLPWMLGHGVYIAKVEGISGGYDCSRISPMRTAQKKIHAHGQEPEPGKPAIPEEPSC